MKIKYLFAPLFFLTACKAPQKIIQQSNNINSLLPALLTGSFMDDYGIRYTINDTMWLQQPSIRYRILQTDTARQFLLAKNDMRNQQIRDYIPVLTICNLIIWNLIIGDFA